MKSNTELPQEALRPETAEQTEAERIDAVAADVLNRYRKAFEELAK